MNPHDHFLELPAGTMIRHFRIERRLGKKGGFAFTYLATDLKLNRKVALKELFPNDLVIRRGTNVVPIANDRETISLWNWALRKFKEEAQHLAKFRHPNIVVVSDLIEANQTAYIVMHYVEGKSFDQVLSESGQPVPEDMLMHVLKGILNGLEAVHREGILHRDVKPNNIYLTKRGGVILLDFGAARPQFRNKQGTSYAVHSDGYSPFEQYMSVPKLSPAADIYAAAATMVRAVSGTRPMNASERAVSDPYVPLAARYRGVYSPALLNTIDAGMAFKPEHRPQSILAWKKMLEKGGTHRVRGPGKTIVVIALLALLVIVLSVIWAVMRMGTGPSMSPERRENGSSWSSDAPVPSAAHLEITSDPHKSIVLFHETQQAGPKTVSETPLVEVFPDMDAPAVVTVEKP